MANLPTGDPATRADYDQWHLDLAKREAEGNVLSKVWYQKVASALPDLNGKSVLEIGCGRGEFSNYLHQRFPQAKIYGADFSPGAVEVCRQRYRQTSELRFGVEDITKLTFPDNTFDVLISCETLEHVPEVEMGVREIRRVLKKKGAFFITTPSYFNAYAIVWLKNLILNKPFESGEGVQPFEHFYTFRYIKSLLKRNKLTLTRSSSTHFQWLVFPRVDPAKLRTLEFHNPIFNRLFKPFGVHFFYQGQREE